MDHPTFDHVTRVFAASGSRRAALRALLGTALLGASTRTTAAAPTTLCDEGRNPQCTCGASAKCPPNQCFWDPCPADKPRGEFCCSTELGYVLCGDRCCLRGPNAADPCAACLRPLRDPAEACAGVGGQAITGSYRRR
jgi:hypothetical protein